MKDRANPRLVQRCRNFAAASAVFAVVVGLSVLAGWKLHIPDLYTWGVFPVRMVPNTAVAFILVGASLWLLRTRDGHSFALATMKIRIRTLTSKILAAAAALLGIFSLAEHALGRSFGIDQRLFVLPAADRITRLRPGLMSSITASNFIVLGIALLLLDWKTRRNDWPSQFLDLGIFTGAALGLLGLLLEPDASYTSMALPTVATFFVLASGLLCSRPAWAVGGLLASDSEGLRFLRKVVPGGLLLFSVIGWLISKPLLTGSHLTWVEVSALAIFCAAIFAAFIAWIAFMFNRGDSERKKLEEALHIDKERMDQRLDRIEEPQAEVELRRKVKLGFAVAIVLTSLLGFLSWRMAEQAADNADWVAHTHEVSTALEATLRHLVDVETGARGFSLTGNQPFLEPYGTGRFAVVEDLRRLRLLLGANVAQTRRVNTLATQTNAQIEAAGELVASRQNTESVPTETQLERGKQLMDGVRATVGEMEAAQNLLLKQRIQQARSAQRFNFSVIALGSVISVFFLSVAGATVSREIGISARARAQVNVLNADLERRVADRTAALAASEGRLAGIIQSATDSIISVDEEQRIVLFNSTAENTFRCPATEALGQPITRFIPHRFHGAHAGHIRAFGDSGVTHRAMGPKSALWALRADGQEFQIEASISQVVTGGKKLFTVILRDVTERKRVEEALHEQSKILDLAQVLGRDMDGRIVLWNTGAERLYGFTREEALGRIAHQLLRTQFPEPPHLIEEQLRRTGAGEGELVHHKRDGERIVVASLWRLYRDEKGNPARILETNTDVTARKQAEEKLAMQAEELARSSEALEAQTAMLKAVLDNMGEGLIAAHQDGRFIIWNDAARHLMGRGPENLPTEQWTPHYQVYLPDGITPYPPDRLPLVRAMHGESVLVELVIQPPEAVPGRVLEVAARPLRNVQGTLYGGVCLLRDVTRSKEDEREIRKLNDELEIRVLERTAQLEAANKELETFSYSASHDLRAPLRHISGFSQILLEEFGATLDPGAKHYLDRIQRGTQKMGELVDELLNLARVGRHELNRQTSNLNAIVADVIAMLEPEIEGRQVEWVIADLPEVKCDPVLVKQIYQNLLTNALKFTRPRGHAVIALSHQEQDGQTVFVVRDNGIGFDMKYVDKLFGVFQRLHSPEQFEGTGIGLATVQRIVQKHGGIAWAEAESDKGATFYFTLGVEKQTESKSSGATAGGQL